MTFREAIRKAMADEMASDKNVVLFGEDIGVYGGCFKVTEGLAFGEIKNTLFKAVIGFGSLERGLQLAVLEDCQRMRVQVQAS